MKKSFIKITSLLLITGLSWMGLSAIGDTFAYYSDTETSTNNLYTASSLDFHLVSLQDFSPLVTPEQTSSRAVDVSNDGILDFEYSVEADHFIGALCSHLNLEASLEGSVVYTGPLIGFSYGTIMFPDAGSWDFVVNLASNDPGLQDQICTFDFIYTATQVGGYGFSDEEIIPNTVVSGQWQEPEPPPGPDLGLKINEVYYDVFDVLPQCAENKSEWVELYNPTDVAISLKNWQICYGYGAGLVCDQINSNTLISPFDFAVIAHDNSPWTNCFSVRDEAAKVNLGGSWSLLDNDAGYIILRDPSDMEIDCVSWGNDPNTCGFPDLPLLSVADGYSIARRTKGVDTDTVADWEDLYPPNPGTNPHSMSGVCLLKPGQEDDMDDQDLAPEDPNQDIGGTSEIDAFSSGETTEAFSPEPEDVDPLGEEELINDTPFLKEILEPLVEEDLEQGDEPPQDPLALGFVPVVLEEDLPPDPPQDLLENIEPVEKDVEEDVQEDVQEDIQEEVQEDSNPQEQVDSVQEESVVEE